jgi:MoaA/NifB/PqqE/SkfB family radical SAM enzyme
VGILHRVYSRAATEVWETETRLMRAFALARRPVAVQWVVTTACDLHCPHCYSGAGRRTKDELSTDEAKTLVIDQLVALGRPLLVLSGGELLLRRDIGEIIEYARACGLDYAIHTHGGHVAKHRALFERHPPVLAAISLDGDRELHDRFRGRQGSFDAAIDAMGILRACGCPEIVAGTTITRESADRLVDLFPIVMKSGAHTWGLHLFAPEGRGSEHLELLPTPTQLRRVVAFAMRRRAQFHVELCNEWGSAGALDSYVRDQPFACGAGRISCVVSPTGEVLPCTTTDATESEGNVRARPLAALWTEGFARFRGDTDDPSVDPRQCWLQTRHDVWIGPDAFGLPRDVPVPRERMLWRWIAARTSRPAGRIASPRVNALVHAAAVGLVFAQACVTKTSEPAPPGEATPDATPTKPVASARPQLERELAALAEPSALRELPSELVDAPHFHFGNAGIFGQIFADVAALDPHAAPQPKAEPQAPIDPNATRNRVRQLQVHLKGNDVAAFRSLLEEHLDRRERGEPETPGELVGLLNVAEQLPTYSPVLAAYLWRRARELEPPANDDGRFAIDRAHLYLRLHHHLRVVDALARAVAVTGPITYRPWISKAAPTGQRPLLPASLVDALRKAWSERDDAGPWDRVGADVVLEWAQSDPAPLVVGGGRVQAATRGKSVRLRRLDLVFARAPVSVRGPGTLEFSLPAGAELGLDRLAERLPTAARAELDDLVARAAAGEIEAEGRVEAILPWAQASIRARLAADPGQAGAGKLKMWLVAFDE